MSERREHAVEGAEPLPEGDEQAPPGTRTMAIVRWALVGLMAFAAVGAWVHYGASAGVLGEVRQFHCPMHPAVVMVNEGECPICGMDLVAVAHAPDADPDGKAAAHGEAKPLYVCPMDCVPGFATEDPKARCPKCGMKLVAKAPLAHAHEGVPGLVPVQLTLDRVQLAGMQTALAVREPLSSRIRTVGFVDAERAQRRLGERAVLGLGREARRRPDGRARRSRAGPRGDLQPGDAELAAGVPERREVGRSPSRGRRRLAAVHARHRESRARRARAARSSRRRDRGHRRSREGRPNVAHRERPGAHPRPRRPEERAARGVRAARNRALPDRRSLDACGCSPTSTRASSSACASGSRRRSSSRPTPANGSTGRSSSSAPALERRHAHAPGCASSSRTPA